MLGAGDVRITCEHGILTTGGVRITCQHGSLDTFMLYFAILTRASRSLSVRFFSEADSHSYLAFKNGQKGTPKKAPKRAQPHQDRPKKAQRRPQDRAKKAAIKQPKSSRKAAEKQ